MYSDPHSTPKTENQTSANNLSAYPCTKIVIGQYLFQVLRSNFGLEFYLISGQIGLKWMNVSNTCCDETNYS